MDERTDRALAHPCPPLPLHPHPHLPQPRPLHAVEAHSSLPRPRPPLRFRLPPRLPLPPALVRHVHSSLQYESQQRLAPHWPVRAVRGWAHGQTKIVFVVAVVAAVAVGEQDAFDQ